MAKMQSIQVEINLDLDEMKQSLNELELKLEEFKIKRAELEQINKETHSLIMKINGMELMPTITMPSKKAE